MTQINVNIDNNLKVSSENIFNELGLSVSDAIRIFLKKVVSENGIPFDLKIKKEKEIAWNDLNEETKKAIMSNEKGELVEDVDDIWK